MVSFHIQLKAIQQQKGKQGVGRTSCDENQAWRSTESNKAEKQSYQRVLNRKPSASSQFDREVNLKAISSQ